MSAVGKLRIGIALEGSGWHPASWQASSLERPELLFRAAFWQDLAVRLDRSAIDFVTIEDGISLQSSIFAAADGRADQFRGRIDSLVLGTLILAATERLAVILTRNVTHGRAFQVAAQVASLANLAPGRVGWRPQVSANPRDSVLVGGELTPEVQLDDLGVPIRIGHRIRALFDDAADFVAVVRELWGTFPGAALVGALADAPGGGPAAAGVVGAERPGRDFLDLARLRTEPIIHGGTRAAGPLNVPALAVPETVSMAHHALEPYRFAVSASDSVLVTPTAEISLRKILSTLEVIEELTPTATPTRVLGDLIVILGDTPAQARSRQAELDGALGGEWAADAQVFVGTATELAELLADWAAEERFSGVRLRPAVVPEDIDRLIEEVIPLVRG